MHGAPAQRMEGGKERLSRQPRHNLDEARDAQAADWEKKRAWTALPMHNSGSSDCQIINIEDLKK
jgi:hypothetical protein